MINTFNIDILNYIYSFIEYADDAYNMRLANKVCSMAGLYFIQQSSNKLYFRATFVESCCNVCKSDKCKHTFIPYDQHPKRSVYFCNKWTCQSSILSSLIRIYNNEHLYPWIRWYSTCKIFPVLRSSGEYSKGKALHDIFYIKDNKPLVNVIFMNENHKYKQDVYKDNSQYELSKLYSPSNIDFSYIEGKPCFLSLFPEAKIMFIPRIRVYISFTNNIKIKFKIISILNPKIKNGNN